MSRWVQHISGQGAKYELTDSMWNRADNSSWETRNNTSNNLSWFHLPRSEYRECPPPPRRVTEKCVVGRKAGEAHLKLTTTDTKIAAWLPTGYRFEMLRKEELADGEICLVIEKVD